MKQTTLCVPLEVKPESCSRLSAIIDEFRRREDTGQIGEENFVRHKRDIPVLHFMSISVVTRYRRMLEMTVGVRRQRLELVG